MSNTASTEPFTLRIPSPDPDLTGQVLAKAVPDDPSRTGSIYADQFLAHKCPSHFDDVQRRQFFCILDLRRLKYTADEIFTKKDWKLNILNFAKEYEKSRGLIMLRYGLYEFKTVKPSNAVLKKWRAAHGLTSETEADHSSSPSRSRVDPAGSSKRKFEEDSTSRDSNVNQNKRRNLAQEVNDSVLNKPAPFKKSKRKADETEELDESKPNKQQKSTPSTATSLFESILNKTRNDGPSPSKQTSQPASLFAISNLFPNPAKPNIASTLSGSVLADHKIGSTPAANTGNIFSYLSESSPSSDGNEDDNADEHESDSGAEPDSDEQNASAAVSTGTSTPPVQNGSLFGVDQKTSQTPSIFGGLSKPADQTTKGGLFGRIQMGANGQPVRANARPDEKREGALNASNQFSTPTPSPSSSFNFSFGQQPSSDPKTAAAPPSQGVGLFGNSTKTNGAPSFSFTQASPDSPFPVPSSIGTTPVNGTPEPHAPQEDGEEAPHAQISLTDGGPGEEDETLVHEVRAKAIKYIPVKKDDEDQEKSQSPWSTRGVGPLRILKNKSTGAVRILLRAEPRGHVALNKAILPDVEYKPKSKTVNFVAADDNGSGLETWLLQVKTAELAAELAGVLETNKTANKK
ncbi:hypothetical protein F5Y03DRAFT_383327 [Xylaria venustula]|nr:hypothetical protein F5Y03DRAFT_383327 [Xylaria venustula]